MLLNGKLGKSSRKIVRKRQLQCEALEDRRVLAVFTVTVNSDAAVPANGSLRWAVQQANAAPGADTINFAAALAGGTISLTAGQLTITDSVTVDGPANPVTVQGPGDVATGFRIFKVDNSQASLINVSMDDMIIRGGNAKPEADALDPGNAAFRDIGRGGGIDSRENLTLTRIQLTDNFGRRGANLSVTAPGGDNTVQHLATTTIRDSVISNGRSDWLAGGTAPSGRAGALGAHNAGVIVIENTTMNNNYSNGVGGHMDIRTGTDLTIRNSTMSNGEAQYRGSAIYGQRSEAFADTKITLDNVTVTGGFTSLPDAASFGAVHMLSGELIIIDSDITNNSGETGVSLRAGGPTFLTVADPSARLTVQDSQISGNSNGGIGTGLIVGFDETLGQGNVMNISGSTISGNGTPADAYSYGGAIFVYDEFTRITNTTISGNFGDFGGGLLFLGSLDAEISNSTIKDNVAYSIGGGIDVEGGNVTITHSTISGNSAEAFAGGLRALGVGPRTAGNLFPADAVVNLRQSTVSGNESPGSAGGVAAIAADYGNATLNIDGSTITLNESNTAAAATGRGGGVFADKGTYGLSTTVTMHNTIVSGNIDNTPTEAAPDLYDYGAYDYYGSPTPYVTGTYNFIGNIADGKWSGFSEGNPGAGGNIVGGSVSGALNAMLGNLVNNGGPTDTHEPQAGSPVIDKGDPATVGGTDQRGLNRVDNGRVDIGSVETQPVQTLDFNNDGLYDCGDMTMLEAAIDGGVFQATYDVNNDGVLNKDDVFAWLIDAGEVRFGTGRRFKLGDANLDGVVDGGDFGLWNSSKFTNNRNWCQGDFNQDNVVDGADFGIWNSNKFTASDEAPTANPGNEVVHRAGTAGTRQVDRHLRSLRSATSRAGGLMGLSRGEAVAATRTSVQMAAPAAIVVHATERVSEVVAESPVQAKVVAPVIALRSVTATDSLASSMASNKQADAHDEVLKLFDTFNG